MEDQVVDTLGVRDGVLGRKIAAERDAEQRHPGKSQMKTQLLEIVDQERYRVLTIRRLLATTAAALLVVDNRTKPLELGTCQPFEIVVEPARSAMNHDQRRPHVRVAGHTHPVPYAVDHHLRPAHRRSLACATGTEARYGQV
jgi:hypothetical protein